MLAMKTAHELKRPHVHTIVKLEDRFNMELNCNIKENIQAIMDNATGVDKTPATAADKTKSTGMETLLNCHQQIMK